MSCKGSYVMKLTVLRISFRAFLKSIHKFSLVVEDSPSPRYFSFRSIEKGSIKFAMKTVNVPVTSILYYMFPPYVEISTFILESRWSGDSRSYHFPISFKDIAA